MTGSWWKLLAIALILYVIVAGLIVPLKPGITGVTPPAAVPGTTIQLVVTCYNTRLTAGRSTLEAWLKLNKDFLLKAGDAHVIDETTAELQFEIPGTFPVPGTVHGLTLILNDSIHGAFVLPNAIVIRGGSYSPAAGASWHPAERFRAWPVDTFRYPYRSILYETIRNVYFHVPMWFGMLFLYFASAWFSIRYIRRNEPMEDLWSLALNSTGTLFGIMGLLTGMLWSHSTWGAFWSWDIKQNTAAIALLIYLAYFVLRQSVHDDDRRARVAAVYNIFGCTMLIPLLFVLPRMTDSLHPGSGGNPALGGEDLDNTMRMVFYPAVIGWILLGVWLSQLRFRILRLRRRRIFDK